MTDDTLDLAKPASDAPLRVVPSENCNAELFPNILFTDRIEDNRAADLSMWVNAGCP